MSEENTGFEIISPQNYKALIHYLLAFNAAVKKPSATALPSSLYIPHFFPDVSKFFFFYNWYPKMSWSCALTWVFFKRFRCDFLNINAHVFQS